MDFKELGRLFAQKREQLGVSVADISESTRISQRILDAFEQGDLSHLPHPVYAKGFIKNYAKFLGLDPQESVRVLMRELQPDMGHETLAAREISLKEMVDSQSTGIGKSVWPVALGVLALVGALGLMIWYFSFYIPAPTLEVQAQATVSQVAPVPVVEQVEQVQPSNAEVVQEPEAIVEDIVALETNEQPEPAQDQALPTLSVQASALAIEPTPQSSYAPAATVANDNVLHTLTISITGEEPCWIGVWIPGTEEISKDFTVDAGKSVNYRFQGERLIRFGRIENVQLTLDGVERPVKGTGVVNLTLP